MGGGRIRHLLAASALGAAIAMPAFAQEAGTPADDAQSTAAGDIIVTAQRRAERLQDVPLSVVAVGPERLENLRYNDSSDIQYLVPGVTAGATAGPRNFGFFVRGIGTTSFSSEGIEASTAYVLDGVVLGQSGASVTDLPDVERIEVLRGPQGTLFGKNASAGVINIVTRRPSDTFEVRASASWGWPYDDQRYSVYVSGPITEGMRFSLSGRRNVRGGYIENVHDGRRLNDRDEYGLRGKLEFNPTSDLRVTMIGDYFERNANCCIWTLYDVGTPPGINEALSLAAGIDPGIGNQQQNVDGDVFSDAKSYGASIQADWSFGDGYTLTSISALRHWRSYDGLDSDSSPLDLLDTNYARFKQDQFTQELRLASPTGGLIDYVVGLYYFESDVVSRSHQIYPAIPLPFWTRQVRIGSTMRNVAAFGQANLNLTDRFRLIAGARVLRETIDVDKRRFDPRFGVSDSASARKESEAVVWRGGAQYDFTPDINAFATVTRGFKGGGFDTNIGSPVLREVSPERPTNYEIGLRTSWPGIGLTFNVTGFHTRIRDYQVAGRDATTGTYPITNSDARTQGVEVDVSLRPRGTNLTLTANGSYVDAQWGDFANAPCFGGQTAAEGCTGGQQDLTGKPLPYSPKWQLAFGGNYVAPLTIGLNLTFDLGVSYRSSHLVSFPNNPRARQDGYALVNGAIGLAGDKDRWRVAVYARNLFDQEFISTIFSTPFGNARSLSAFRTYESRRSVGVSLDVDF